MPEDFADFEIIAELDSPNDREKRIALRCIAEIDGVGYLQDDIILVYPTDIDTFDKLAAHINQFVVAPWFAELTKPPEPVETECPLCKTCPGCGGTIDATTIIRQPDNFLKCVKCLRIFSWADAVSAVPLYKGECMVCGWKVSI